MRDSCVVLLSGGQDSATCLAWAGREFKDVHTISFDYGQRHIRELNCSLTLSELAGVKSHKEIKVSSLSKLGGSALIGNDGGVNKKHERNKTLPASFVPGRNYIFLGLAAAHAYSMDIGDLVTGVCETDSSGYPDCRDGTIKLIQVSLSLAMDYEFVIHTPLMWRTKAEIIRLMMKLGRLSWYKETHTCYNGVYPPCGECNSCLLREKGFKEAHVFDPLLFMEED